MTKELLNKFKEILIAKRDQIEMNINKFAKKNSDGVYEVIHEEFGNSEEDNTDEIEGDMQNASLLVTLTQQLKSVEDALERVESGNFGKCESCGNDIEEKRLEFNPESHLCASCQNKKEKDLI